MLRQDGGAWYARATGMPTLYAAKTPADLRGIARDILTTHPRLLALVGPRGAGKTTLTQAIGKELGIQQQLTSPTYVLQQVYRIPPGTPHGEAGGGRFDSNPTYDTLVHVDCYRIQADHEVPALDLAYWCERPKTLVVVEWADRIRKHLADVQPVWVTFTVRGRERRLVIS